MFLDFCSLGFVEDVRDYFSRCQRLGAGVTCVSRFCFLGFVEDVRDYSFRCQRLGASVTCVSCFFFFFFQIAARQVAVKLHTLFFFLKMAASGRVGNEIWQVHQVARKLHICVFFFFQIAVFVAARGQPTAQARNSTRPRLGKKQGVHTEPAVPLCCKAVC